MVMLDAHGKTVLSWLSGVRISFNSQCFSITELAKSSILW
jgi:hypothetical protein